MNLNTSFCVFNRSLTNFERTQCILLRTFTIGSVIHPNSIPNQNLVTKKFRIHSNPLPLIFRRSRYSFIYAKKPFNISNAGLSSLNNEKVEDCFRQKESLNESQVNDLILRLTEEERATLLSALQAYESNKVKSEYEGQLAATRWRSKLGRPSKLPTLGDVDPTGTYCHLTEDWLKKKYAESVPVPTSQQLMQVAIFNAIPFVGFGFLDNFIMIVAGDYIDETLGAFVTLSTMAAAALGNTISDVLGIGSAWYVELAALKIGLKPPNLSPIQLDMRSSRRAANLGRAMGITIGCLLGMVPLLFMNKDSDKKKEAEKAEKVDKK